MQEYYLSVLSAPRPGRGGHSARLAFSSDVDLAALDAEAAGHSSDDGGKLHGSCGEHGRAGRSGSSTLADQLYNTLVRSFKT